LIESGRTVKKYIIMVATRDICDGDECIDPVNGYRDEPDNDKVMRNFPARTDTFPFRHSENEILKNENVIKDYQEKIAAQGEGFLRKKEQSKEIAAGLFPLCIASDYSKRFRC
jgi:hypothetical protein